MTMTREEAKEILTHNWTRVDNPNYSESELDEAFFMAIEALLEKSDDSKSFSDSAEPSTLEVPIKYPSDRSREIIVLFDREDGVGDKCDLCRHAFVGEIVRCDKCVHWNGETKGCKRNPSVEAWWENDFCSYGERREPSK